jgi:hypothetical protein
MGSAGDRTYFVIRYDAVTFCTCTTYIRRFKKKITTQARSNAGKRGALERAKVGVVGN